MSATDHVFARFRTTRMQLFAADSNESVFEVDFAFGVNSFTDLLVTLTSVFNFQPDTVRFFFETSRLIAVPVEQAELYYAFDLIRVSGVIGGYRVVTSEDLPTTVEDSGEGYYELTRLLWLKIDPSEAERLVAERLKSCEV